MNRSKKFLEKYNQLKEDKTELEEIKQFEDEIHRKYGPCVARGLEEIKALFEQLKKERQQNAAE